MSELDDKIEADLPNATHVTLIKKISELKRENNKLQTQIEVDNSRYHLSSDGKFYLGVWGFAAAVICVLIIAIASYNIHTNVVHDSIIAKGANPLDVRCANATEQTLNSPACLERAKQK